MEGNGSAICISGEPDISLENLTFERCTTSNSSATVAKNISMYQVNKYLHSDDYARSFSMKNTKEVSTPLFASMISENISLMIIIGGVIIIAGVIVILYFRKRRKEGRKDEAKDEHIGAETDKENE